MLQLSIKWFHGRPHRSLPFMLLICKASCSGLLGRLYNSPLSPKAQVETWESLCRVYQQTKALTQPGQWSPNNRRISLAFILSYCCWQKTRSTALRVSEEINIWQEPKLFQHEDLGYSACEKQLIFKGPRDSILMSKLNCDGKAINSPPSDSYQY